MAAKAEPAALPELWSSALESVSDKQNKRTGKFSCIFWRCCCQVIGVVCSICRRGASLLVAINCLNVLSTT